MKPTFWYAFRLLRGQMLGWGIALLVIAVIGMSTYKFVLEQEETLKELIKEMPPALKMFTGDLSHVSDPVVFLDLRFFKLMPLILGIFAVVVGSGMIASDEEAGRLDLLLAYPISRAQLFCGRLLAVIAALCGILILAWLGLALGIVISPMTISPGSIAPAFLSLLCTLLVMAAISLLLSFLLPSRRLAGTVGGLILVVSFLFAGLAPLSPVIEVLSHLLPLQYYQGAGAMKDLDVAYLIGLCTVSVLLTVLAYHLFRRKDIRVAGEGTFRWRQFWPF